MNQNVIALFFVGVGCLLTSLPSMAQSQKESAAKRSYLGMTPDNLILADLTIIGGGLTFWNLSMGKAKEDLNADLKERAKFEKSIRGGEFADDIINFKPRVGGSFATDWEMKKISSAIKEWGEDAPPALASAVRELELKGKLSAEAIESLEQYSAKVRAELNTEFNKRVAHNPRIKKIRGIAIIAGGVLVADALGHVFAIKRDDPNPRFVGSFVVDIAKLSAASVSGLLIEKKYNEVKAEKSASIEKNSRGTKEEFLNESQKSQRH